MPKLLRCLLVGVGALALAACGAAQPALPTRASTLSTGAPDNLPTPQIILGFPTLPSAAAPTDTPTIPLGAAPTVATAVAVSTPISSPPRPTGGTPSPATPPAPPATLATTATLAPPASAGCANPLARITAPAANETLRGTVPFVGAANTPDFLFYKVQYMPDSSRGTDRWGELYQSKARVLNGKLMEWQTHTVAPGVYWLRLLVTDRTGNYPEPCEVRVVVER